MMKAFLTTSLTLLCLMIGDTAEAVRDGVSYEEEIPNLIREYVARQLSSGPEEIRVNRVIPTNGGSFRWSGEVKGVRAGTRGRLLGRVLFVLSIKENDSRTTSRWVTAEIERVQKMVVASRSLKRHHVIGPTDLMVQTISVTRQQDDYVTRPEALIGKRMIRSIRKGVPIRSDLVEEAPLIHRGDRVMLVLESRGLQIMTLGRAKEDGFQGGIIGVMNTDSRKIVYGEVVEAGVVRVSFGP